MNMISNEGTTKVGLAVNVEGFQCLVQRFHKRPIFHVEPPPDCTLTLSNVSLLW